MTTQELNRKKVIDALVTYRKEWESDNQSVNLLYARCSVALVLLDILQAIKLDQAEQSQVLGQELFISVKDFTG
jgi:hypothetical protein